MWALHRRRLLRFAQTWLRRLTSNADGFEATSGHLPLAASGLVERIRIDPCLLMCIAAGLACMLGGLLVLTIAPVLSPLVLAAELLAASATDIAREHIEPPSRRVNVMVSRGPAAQQPPAGSLSAPFTCALGVRSS